MRAVGNIGTARLPCTNVPAARAPPRRVRGASLVVHADAGKGAREPWDVGRFAKTVFYFNEPPKPADLIAALGKAFAGLLPGGSTSSSGGAASSAGPLELLTSSPGGGAASSSAGVVLVTGATGGVGKRVVQRLLAQGRHVRALVRDVPKAKQLLAGLPAAPGGRLEVAAADIVQPATLQPWMFEGVRAAVSCTAVKVQPKEGDTADRAKYMQGIKFYDPEVVGDTPETVELRGLSNLLQAVAPHLGFEAGQALLAPEAALLDRWGALDDVVMGGVSESSLLLVRGAGEDGGDALVFRGVVSTNNSGGFVSVRCKNWSPPLDLGAYSGLRLRVKGNGLRYKMILRADTNWDGVSHCRSFDTREGEWQTIDLPFSDFKPTFRARSLPDGPPLNPSNLCSIQLMHSKFEYDGQLNPAFKEGLVELPIAEIRAVLPQPLSPRFVHVSSAGVTRPNRPGINVDVEPPAVKMNDMLGGLLTYKLAGEDAVRRAGVPFAVVRPCALTEEPAGAPLELDQGDTIKGKISREDVAELCVQVLGSSAGPLALDTTFEIKCTLPFSQPWQVDESAPPVPRDWTEVLSGAGLRKGVTGKTVGGVYTGREPEPQTEAIAAAVGQQRLSKAVV